MNYKKINPNEFELKPFKEIGKDWILISAKKEDQVNTMTASWAGIGLLWEKNVVTVYLRPQRYTKEFIDGSDYFTITMFDGHKKELAVLGSKSGRDGDKISEVGFDIEYVDEQPTFKQGKCVIICKKLYCGKIHEENFINVDFIDKVYPNKDFHYIYVGEVVSIYRNDSK